MRWLSTLFSPIVTLTDRVVCVLFAVAFAQGPTYIAQYMDVLSGAEMEARNTYERVEDRAIQRGMGVNEYIQQTIEETPRGIEAWEYVQDTKGTVERYQRYRAALDALERSSPWTKPWVLAYHFESSIHKAIRFEPNVPLTYEGGMYGLVGVVLALLLIGAIKGLLRLFSGKRRTSTTL